MLKLAARKMPHTTSTTTPLVSVVIPAYNAVRWLAQTIDSVLGQTLADLEVIVVDDGSTDSTRQVATSFSDRRVRYCFQQNKGLSGARNTGIRATCGRYVALLDADDLFRPVKLAKQVALLERRPDLGLVTCGFGLVDEEGVAIGEQCSWYQHPTIDLRSLLFWNPLLPSTLVLRREWFDRVGAFDETLRRYEDWEFAVRLAAAGCRMDYVRETLVDYRRHATNMSTAAALVPVATQAADRFMKALFDRSDLDEGIRAIRHKAFGNLYLDAAARAFGAGLDSQGREWLHLAIDFDRELLHGNPPAWLNTLCGHALMALVHDQRDYLRLIVANQPRKTGLPPWRMRHLLALTTAARAFTAYSVGNRQVARALALRSILLNPILLRNRGLVAVGLRPW